jgi:hypothetical protein
VGCTQKLFHNIGSWLENVFSPDLFAVQSSSKQRKEERLKTQLQNRKKIGSTKR